MDYVRYTYYIYYDFASVCCRSDGRMVGWSFVGRAALCLAVCAEQGPAFGRSSSLFRIKELHDTEILLTYKK